MKLSIKIALFKLILINLIPVFGVIFLDWELFEIGISYILETCALYLVFELDYYFIDRQTRFPFIMALIQLLFTALTFSALMYGSAIIIYTIITPQIGEYRDFIDRFFYKLTAMNLAFPAIGMFLIELISFYLLKRKDSNHQTKNTWRVIRRILYSHLYMVASLILLSIFPQNLFVLIPFFIGLKMILEYSTEDARIYRAVTDWFFTTRLGLATKANFSKKKPPAGYLLKNRTYRSRKHQK